VLLPDERITGDLEERLPILGPEGAEFEEIALQGGLEIERQRQETPERVRIRPTICRQRNRMATRSSAACSGRPEGLSLVRMRVPVRELGEEKVRVTWKGTNSVVIHSPSACAGTRAMVSPAASRR
jgi:hypothetical protein